MRIIGLIILGLILLNGILRIFMNAIAMANGSDTNAAPGYMASRLMASIAIEALVAFFFVKLLKKTS